MLNAQRRRPFWTSGLMTGVTHASVADRSGQRAISEEEGPDHSHHETLGQIC